MSAASPRTTQRSRRIETSGIAPFTSGMSGVMRMAAAARLGMISKKELVDRDEVAGVVPLAGRIVSEQSRRRIKSASCASNKFGRGAGSSGIVKSMATPSMVSSPSITANMLDGPPTSVAAGRKTRLGEKPAPATRSTLASSIRIGRQTSGPLKRSSIRTAMSPGRVSPGSGSTNSSSAAASARASAAS